MAEHLDKHVARLKSRLADLKRSQADHNTQRALALQIRALEDELRFLAVGLTGEEVRH